MPSKHRRDERGNVLFLILIAVALFAALSYAVTSSTRSGNPDTSQEQADILSSQILQWFDGAKAEIERMRMIDGVPIDGFNFQGHGTGWVQPCAPFDEECVFFDDKGGDYQPLTVARDKFLFDDPTDGRCDGPRENYGLRLTQPYLVRIADVGDPGKAELVFDMSCVKEDICERINKRSGIDGVPVDSYSNTRYEFGASDDMPEPPGGPSGTIGDEAAELAGQHAFCFKPSANSFYDGRGRYIRVMIAQ